MSKLVELAKIWSSSAGTFAGAGGLAMLYFTDWKAVLQYLPIYNTKWSEEK